ncbi:hypothetical protein Ari01nite_30260 [Paractinoplanes rishiriensis]|uniref:Uncharacterized protein n=1 Tax=Paractinoplanes rishiriensis TaxID=1050105 RepID=A0A919K2R3_9ACTN|nr:hypothetical protein Ari01nite_30260 [Actinoplanes rishiriensis]
MVLGIGGGAIAYGRLGQDSGVAACAAIRDSRFSQSSGSAEDMTVEQHRQVRELFADSGNDEIREHGTKLVDLIWQVQQMGDDAGLGALALGYEIPASKSLVKITFTFRNTTSGPIPIEAASQWLTLMYGPNRTEGESEAGYSSDDESEQLSNQDEPTRIAASGSVRMWRTFAVPTGGLTELAVRVDQPEVPGSTGMPAAYTFTEVEKLLTARPIR